MITSLPDCTGNRFLVYKGKAYPTRPFELDESSHTCHDCGVAPGGHHHPGCDMERCPICDKQLIGCEHNQGDIVIMPPDPVIIVPPTEKYERLTPEKIIQSLAALQMYPDNPSSLMTLAPGPVRLRVSWRDVVACRLLDWLMDELPPTATGRDLQDILLAAIWWDTALISIETTDDNAPQADPPAPK